MMYEFINKIKELRYNCIVINFLFEYEYYLRYVWDAFGEKRRYRPRQCGGVFL